ncbi:transglycosylase SLT domain-containing protein [Salinisphaera sp. Q1T1-3]|uniref:transglycosylase SLT domain-containing protein n=1 Tax=Salinisphaera sp. Q1T1-3 TaxID=2321229 RepID=UPI000E720C4A|nr:transglycosylase SLT domain-containing protein [Salinisphaera sp. Q1T1-3]RJS91263.1 hypothetical protein D3260_16010 [Salinisphaera sp. Q1T1-3]
MRALLVLGALFVAPLVATAATPPNADSISNYDSATRRDFMDALSAARRGNLSSHADEVARLRDYPLFDYLRAAELRHDLSGNADATLDSRIARFVQAHPDLPPAQRLKSHWLDNLADRGQWQTIVDQTRDEDSTTATCRRVAAQIKLGRATLGQARALYDVGASQPSACDPVFAWLESTGNLTSALVRDRAHKAILAGNTGLASYLSRQLPSADTATVDTWLSALNNPSTLAQAAPDLDDDIVVAAFKRFALADPASAADALPGIVTRFGLDAADQYQVKRYIALLFAEEHRPEALLWYARLDHARMVEEADDHALGWEIRAAIYQRRWPLVLDFINALPASIAKDEEWRYWRARALAETGHKNQAKTLYASLAAERSYHGYLAADALGMKYRFNERPVPNDPAVQARLQNDAGFRRARELYALGMDSYAYLEWKQLAATLPKDQLMQAARMAYQWQWYARAILTLADADYWDDLDIRYPTPFAATVRQAARTNDLDPAYVYAIIRTESLFQPTVRSPVGARGLMQLMPGTADHLARQMGRSAPSASALNDPATNVGFGTRYLADMMADWSNNIALATASYNAGPRKIAQWLPATDMPADIWIANIPYTETRKYVQRVMSHMTVFQHRLSESVTPLDKRLDTVRPSYRTSNDTTF